MLEYPVTGLKYHFDRRRPVVADGYPRGILLLREKLSNRLGSSQIVTELVAPMLGSEADSTKLCCVDVFGPFDYVLEFEASDSEQFEFTKSRILNELSAQLLKSESLFCEPF
jgi:hypothetical protein